MSIVEIKFADSMKRAVLEGRKCATTRSEPKGEIGDVFYIEDPHGKIAYRIISIRPILLGTVASRYHREEGCESYLDFVGLWKSLFGKYKPDELYFIHFFQCIPERYE